MLNKHQVGCSPADVLFLIEEADLDTRHAAVQHQGNFISYLVGKFSNDVRIGVFAYHDVIDKISSLSEFTDDKAGLIQRIQSYTQESTGLLTPSGSADLATALDFMREVFLNHSRPGVPKVVIPIIHQMPNDDISQNDIKVVGHQLRNGQNCVSIIPVIVHSASVNYETIEQTIDQPFDDFSYQFAHYAQMETKVTKTFSNCTNMSTTHVPQTSITGLTTNIPHSTTTNLVATIPSHPQHPDCQILDKSLVGCTPADVIFMIEYANIDQFGQALQHQGNFFTGLVDKWNSDVHIGVVTYHDTVQQIASLTEFVSDKQALKSRIQSYTDNATLLTPSGTADLARALRFVRQHSFNDSRPGVPQVVIPIIHEMRQDFQSQQEIIVAGDVMKNGHCTSILPVIVHNNKQINYETIQHIVHQPYWNYMSNFRTYAVMEKQGPDTFNCV